MVLFGILGIIEKAISSILRRLRVKVRISLASSQLDCLPAQVDKHIRIHWEAQNINLTYHKYCECARDFSKQNVSYVSR